MFCPKCGKQIDDDSVFCEYCGENVEETPADPFQTVYADDSADYNNDYTDNYADNYADDYNNAYPANFTEPEPMPSPAPEKSGKKMIAAVCAVCSVMLVLMAVLCAKFIFGGNKIQTDDPSANSLAAVVTTTADSLSVITQDSSVAETAVTTAATTAATTAPAAESSSSKAVSTSQGEKKSEKEQLSAVQLKRMTIGEISDYVGDDFEIIRIVSHVSDFGPMNLDAVTSAKYFPNIMITNYGEYDDIYTDEELRELFKSQDKRNCEPMVYMNQGGLIGDNTYLGDTYNDMITKIDCLTGVGRDMTCYSVVSGEVVRIKFDYLYEDTGVTHVDAGDSKCIDIDLYPELDGMDLERTVKNTAMLKTCESYDSETLWTLEPGQKVYLYSDIGENYGPDGIWYFVTKCYVDHDGRKVKKIGYIEVSAFR